MTTVEDLIEPHDPEQVPVHVAFNRVKRDVGAVGKNRRNEAQNYSFRSIEDFIDAVSPVLAWHGVIMLPNIVEHRLYHFERTTNNDRRSTSTVATVTTEWHVIGPMGDSFTFRTVGEGADTADKATNKAMSAAFKYAMAQGMAIPLHLDDGDATNGANDNDATTSTRAPRKAAAKKVAARPAREQRQQRQQRPAAEDQQAPPPAEELPPSQQRLVDRILALPDAHQHAIAEFCRSEQIKLKRPVAADVLATVAAFVDALPDHIEA